MAPIMAPIARIHYLDLIDSYKYPIIFIEGDQNEYNIETKTLYIVKPQNNAQYWDFLHEYAHSLLNHKPNTWDKEVICEISAWNWVYKNSVIEVSEKYKEDRDRERIKGSWEKSTII